MSGREILNLQTFSDNQAYKPSHREPIIIVFPQRYDHYIMKPGPLKNVSQRFPEMSRKKQKLSNPKLYHQCEPEQLTLLISRMFDKLISHNDNVIVLEPTRFHARSPCAISIHDYLSRITKFLVVERATLLMLVCYVDRICQLKPIYMITSLTAHRFIITAIVIACKTISDTYSTNTFYARVGGLPLGELNILELEMITVLDWNLGCTNEVLQQYYENLLTS